MDIEWKQVFVKEYDPADITASAFGIGDFVAGQDVNGVVILGPNPATEAFEKEEDFRHYTLKILENLSLKACWIPYERMKSPAANTKALMDMM